MSKAEGRVPTRPTSHGTGPSIPRPGDTPRRRYGRRYRRVEIDRDPRGQWAGGDAVTEDIGATVKEWVNVIRRARLDKTTKLVALMVASYANPDGRHVFPGVARLTVQCHIGYSSARRALATLRAVGLLQLTRRGNRRAGKSDEYRLILAEHLLERVELLTPDEERARIADVAQQHRSPVSREA